MWIYKNGNYTVKIHDDGTKERLADTSILKPVFPESVDIKITNDCDMGCEFCHENSYKGGKHGNIHLPFLNKLHYGMELAVGGGNIFQHPDLEEFLVNIKKQGVICNTTIHQTHAVKNIDYVKSLIDRQLIKGLGISFNGNIFELKYLLDSLDNYSNLVLHIINGIIGVIDLKLISRFKHPPKILILGYKSLRRGVPFQEKFSETIKKRQDELSGVIDKLILNFPIVSFDNLAIEQFQLASRLKEDIWKEFYMGNDGQFTMYIDLPNEEFAVSSRELERTPIKETIEEMFEEIRRKRG